MQLYEKALDVFEDDPATSVSYHRHHSHKIACFSISYEHFTYGPFDLFSLVAGYPTQASAKKYGHSNS
jgi:hypothetical protein